MFRSIFASFLIVAGFVGCNSKSTNTQLKEAASDINEAENEEMYMLVGTYTAGESKGIYVYKIDTVTGTSKYVSEVEIDNPSYLVIDKSEKFVYAVTEDDDISKASVSSFSFDKTTGKLSFINKQLTGGAAPCHLNIDNSGKHVIVANYNGGSLSVFETNKDGSLNPALRTISFVGKGVDKERQTQSHIHFTTFSPDEKFLFANDLGTDKIHKFEINSQDSTNYLSIGTPPFFKVEDGLGPRHTAFHPNGKYAYLLTEMGGDVIAFDYNNGNLNQIQKIKADSLHAKGSADIHVSPDGKFLYASNRLKGDGIAIFSINQENGQLTKVAFQTTSFHPRNFAITPNGKLLVVANRDSDLIEVFARNEKTGLLENTLHNINQSMPVCIKFLSVK